MSRPTVLFYCQHSLGLGHLVRSFALAGALAERFRVVLLNGGRLPRGLPTPPGVEIVSLPPLGMTVDGALVDDEAARGERVRAALLDGYASARELPDRADLDWHVAAALLSERALRAVNRVREDGLAHLGPVLADARAVLRGEAVR